MRSLNTAEALRLAREEIKAKYPKPFYWSVFVLYAKNSRVQQ